MKKPTKPARPARQKPQLATTKVSPKAKVLGSLQRLWNTWKDLNVEFTPAQRTAAEQNFRDMARRAIEQGIITVDDLGDMKNDYQRESEWELLGASPGERELEAALEAFF
jgi:hypothetical protein